MVLTDKEIAMLVGERKPAVSPRALFKDFKPAAYPTSRVAKTVVAARDGGAFILRVRQSLLDPYDFSVILSYTPPTGGAEFILRRHNGPSHPHRNPIENERFAGVCHIHEATERYQLKGSRAEHFAQPTERFSDMATALRCMLEDANFESADPPTLPGL